MFLIYFFCIYFLVVLVYVLLSLLCVLCCCIVLCIVSPSVLVYSCLYSICVKFYRPLPTGGNPTADGKYHIILYHITDMPVCCMSLATLHLR
jgi:hypothetical protein